MDKKLEDLLTGLAYSNFYLKYEKLKGRPELLVAKVSDVVHIGPKSGALGFECGQGATAYTVYCVSSDTPGVIDVYVPPLPAAVIRKYAIHQERHTMPKTEMRSVPVRDYKSMASQR